MGLCDVNHSHEIACRFEEEVSRNRITLSKFYGIRGVLAQEIFEGFFYLTALQKTRTLYKTRSTATIAAS
jgi:hypothetical protein